MIVTATATPHPFSFTHFLSMHLFFSSSFFIIRVRVCGGTSGGGRQQERLHRHRTLRQGTNNHFCPLYHFCPPYYNPPHPPTHTTVHHLLILCFSLPSSLSFIDDDAGGGCAYSARRDHGPQPLPRASPHPSPPVRRPPRARPDPRRRPSDARRQRGGRGGVLECEQQQ